MVSERLSRERPADSVGKDERTGRVTTPEQESQICRKHAATTDNEKQTLRFHTELLRCRVDI